MPVQRRVPCQFEIGDIVKSKPYEPFWRDGNLEIVEIRYSDTAFNSDRALLEFKGKPKGGWHDFRFVLVRKGKSFNEILEQQDFNELSRMIRNVTAENT